MNLAKIPVGVPPTGVAAMVGGTPTILTLNHSKKLSQTNAVVSPDLYRIFSCCGYYRMGQFFLFDQF
ncbi:hypothetical protein Ftrac_2808 [Marivirga tractuosa DSM 4126]|uniref:Uncharacterized protein n=1 Tax=Marivirga tractuosa (strain ATCC 23168 / DSM 4126 / NBRC 15989 / NCIMB 1408 / VKM B-1430 / H-43) TaxID=643867 RepID=E4TRT7_MARTH|nr:hypothetical protein Ftrac_2808 [Marivirga tractuosa DSM 4126]